MNEKPILDNDYADDLVTVREMLITEVEQIRKALSNGNSNTWRFECCGNNDGWSTSR